MGTLERIYARHRDDVLASEGRLESALRNLRDSRGGYPTCTAGAGPAGGGPTDEDPVRLTHVERTALTRDPARTALEQVHRLIRRMAKDGAVVASICDQWGVVDADLKKRIDDADKLYLCENCLKHGGRNTKSTTPKRSVCTWCHDFKQGHGYYPTRTLVSKREAFGRITTRDINDDPERPKRGKA